MAAHLQAAGHRLFLHHIGALPQDLLDGSAVGCASGKKVESKDINDISAMLIL
jgi:2-hydroxy-3-oxopropionate reductase